MVFQRRLQRFLLLAAGAIGTVSGCAPPPPPAPVVAAPPAPLPALTILTIQHKAYAEGFAAGEWVQARRDREAAAQQAKDEVTAKMAPETTVPDIDTPDPGMPDTTAQTVESQPSTATQPSAVPASATPAATPAATPPPAPDFMPAGPAQPIPAQQ
jgi:hypothetical protein